MMISIRRTALAAVAAVAALGSTASAAGAVLVPASGGIGAEMPDLPQRVTAVIREVAARHGVIARVSDKTRGAVFAGAGCAEDTDACHQAIMRSLGAGKLILVHVTPGSGGAFADVEVVVATLGKPAVKVAIPLMSDKPDALVAELRNKADRAFASGGSAAASGPPGAPGNPPVPENNTAIKPDVAPGEGGSFSAPTNADKAATPARTEAPAAAVTAPANEPDQDGGYDFTRVNDSTWAIAGSSIGVFVIGALFLNAAGNKEDEINSSRANTLEDFQRIQDLESSGKTLNTIGNTGVLLGLAGMGLAGYLIYREARVPASSNDAKVTIAPVVSPGGFGVMATVRR